MHPDFIELSAIMHNEYLMKTEALFVARQQQWFAVFSEIFKQSALKYSNCKMNHRFRLYPTLNIQCYTHISQTGVIWRKFWYTATNCILIKINSISAQICHKEYRNTPQHMVDYSVFCRVAANIPTWAAPTTQYSYSRFRRAAQWLVSSG